MERIRIEPMPAVERHFRLADRICAAGKTAYIGALMVGETLLQFREAKSARYGHPYADSRQPDWFPLIVDQSTQSEVTSE